MHSCNLTNLVRKAFSNKENRSQFMSDPTSFMSQFQLTELEKKSVLSAHSRLSSASSAGAEGTLNMVEPLIMWL
jgi:hypothetical protein